MVKFMATLWMKRVTVLALSGFMLWSLGQGYGRPDDDPGDPKYDEDPYPEETIRADEAAKMSSQAEQAKDYAIGEVNTLHNTAPDVTMCPKTHIALVLTFPEKQSRQVSATSFSPDVAKGEAYLDILEIQSGANDTQEPKKGVVKVISDANKNAWGDALKVPKQKVYETFVWVTVRPQGQCLVDKHFAQIAPLPPKKPIPPTMPGPGETAKDKPKPPPTPGGVTIGGIPTVPGPLGGEKPPSENKPKPPKETPAGEPPSGKRPQPPPTIGDKPQTDGLKSAQATPSESAFVAQCAETMAQYRAQLESTAQQNWKPPKPPHHGVWEALVKYDVTPDLHLSNIQLVKSSGYGPLDESALSQIYRTQLPPMPECHQGRGFNMEHRFRVTYR